VPWPARIFLKAKGGASLQCSVLSFVHGLILYCKPALTAPQGRGTDCNKVVKTALYRDRG